MADLEKYTDGLAVVGNAFGRLLRGVFGSRNARVVARLQKRAESIGKLESWAQSLSDEEFSVQTKAWRDSLAKGENLESLLPEAFALVREASVRTLGLRHFDVQLIGGMVMHEGGIAEMATGEGKTLAATLSAYLNALEGPVFVVTVNDYLARRDAEWMRPVFEFLGLSVGAIQSEMLPADRHPVYSCDIIYGTNNEFGFDYLRDNMKSRTEDQVQKRLHFAIVDEVDSILIDEARTPLIISGPAVGDADKYRKAMGVARKLKAEKHCELKEKEKQAILTEEGILEAQRLLGIEDFYTGAANMEWPHALEQCLRALHLFKGDVDYVVKDGQIIIVDEFTGRLMEGRRWSDGLHQSVEAKEGIVPRAQNQTLATITFQNYFRMFNKLAGMTGTALTEAGEFARIYDLDVVAIPTNRPAARADEPDVVYLREDDKWKAIVDEIESAQEAGQPILVGTTSIENSELVAKALGRRGIPHEVLNAKHHEREAEIILQAGRKGAVTVATNMAGRGTDIVLGGNPDGLASSEAAGKGLSEEAPGFREIAQKWRETCSAEKEEVIGAGGLYVIGTERHEARRIDNQLRGRAGRQGDPGASRFYLSLDDPLMKRFYREGVKNMLGRLGMGDGEPVESGMVSRAIEKAQKKVENYHFEIRKNLLEYDEVMDRQRHLIYEHRQEALEEGDLEGRVEMMFEEVVNGAVADWAGDGRDVGMDVEALDLWASRKWGWSGGVELLKDAGEESAASLLLKDVESRYAKRKEELGAEQLHGLERFLVLNAIDSKWKDHLYTMDTLRQGIGLRSYAQVDPKNEYKREGLERFQELLGSVADEVTDYILKLQIALGDEGRLGQAWEGQQAVHPAFSSTSAGPVPARPGPQRQVAVGYGEEGPPEDPYSQQRAQQESASLPVTSSSPAPPQEKVPRNSPCPCGSGKKFKRCCGRS